MTVTNFRESAGLGGRLVEWTEWHEGREGRPMLSQCSPGGRLPSKEGPGEALTSEQKREGVEMQSLVYFDGQEGKGSRGRR